MMLMLSEAAHLAGATLTGSDASVLRVVTDSRRIQPGDLFVALKGERFDGHDYVATALAQGAAGAMVSADFKGRDGQSLLIVGDDTLQGLGRLAGGWRQRFSLPVVAITGSNGKTTVKEMLASILQAHAGANQVLVTAGNLNNAIGVPLTLLGMRAQHRYAVIEMGMNHSGELSYLTGLTQPDVALVNNALRAHLGCFDSVEDIARAKSEIFEGLALDGVAVINAEDPHVACFAAAAGAHRIVRFGMAAGEVRARAVTLGSDGSTIDMQTPQGDLSVRLPVPGEHNVRNALAATALAGSLMIPLSSISQGLAGFVGVKGRLQLKTARQGAMVLDDSYNANPDSMKAGIAVLARRPGPLWFVMGDMGELGETAPALHAEIGDLARQSGVDVLLTLGQHSRQSAEAFGPDARHFEQIEPLLQYLNSMLPSAATVLVKGSHFMNMDRVVDHLVGKKGS